MPLPCRILTLHLGLKPGSSKAYTYSMFVIYARRLQKLVSHGQEGVAGISALPLSALSAVASTVQTIWIVRHVDHVQI